MVLAYQPGGPGSNPSLAQWLWYWLINRAALVRIPPGSYISAMHLFISFFVTDFVRKNRVVICYCLEVKRVVHGSVV